MRMNQQHHRWVYVVMGDGELNEGNIWEAAMLASKYKLNNIIGIIDRNNIQIDGPTEVVMPLEDLKGRTSSLIHRTDMTATHIENELAFLYIVTLNYANSEAAQERYNIQDEMIFYQLPSESSKHPWIDMTITTNLNSDRYHVACREIVSDSVGREVQCSGIFLYQHQIVATNIWTVRGDIQYLSSDEVNEIISEIDGTITSGI